MPIAFLFADTLFKHTLFSFEGVPLGTIVAWTPTMPHADSYKAAVPQGWMICDGSRIVEQKSPWFGLSVPDLNGGQR